MATKKNAPKNKTAGDGQKQERWRKQGLALRVSQHQWKVAKWILRGEKIFKSKTKAYDEAIKLTGMTRETLQSFASTARNVKVLTRVKELSFGHHRLVMKYTDEEQKELLNYAKEEGESVESFAAYLRQRDKDAADEADERSTPDRAADTVMETCAAFFKNYNFTKLFNAPPTPVKRTELLDKLKEAAAEMSGLAEKLARAWADEDEADAAFQKGSSKNNKARGAAGK